MIRCEQAAAGDVPALKQLWKQSFDDTDRAIDLFFSRYFEPRDCVVCREDGEPAAMAHMLPVQMAGESGSLPCHYIYAAATRPESRGRGRMRALLQYAAEYGERRGDRYSVLVPANRPLFAYYERLGYRTFSSVRKVILSKEDCLALCGEKNAAEGKPERGEAPDCSSILQIRDQYAAVRPGSLRWDLEAIRRAAALSGVYGGVVIQPGPDGYAFVRRTSAEEIELFECIAGEKAFDKIMDKVVKLSFRICTVRLPADSPLLDGRGERFDFAMYRPLGQNPERTDSCPYVGLPLD